MSFVVDNALLVALAAGSGMALIWPSLMRQSDGVNTISASEAVLLLSRSKPLVLDVREADEFAAGHIQGAVHVPVGELDARVDEFKKYLEKPVLVHCQKGIRSKGACGILKQKAFTQLYQLEGGIEAWQSAKLPLVRD